MRGDNGALLITIRFSLRGVVGFHVETGGVPVSTMWRIE
jgi:hypothetical protein